MELILVTGMLGILVLSAVWTLWFWWAIPGIWAGQAVQAWLKVIP